MIALLLSLHLVSVDTCAKCKAKCAEQTYWNFEPGHYYYKCYRKKCADICEGRDA